MDSRKQQKRPYEPPKLQSVSAIEAGSALCCKSTAATCSNAAKTGSGKGQRTSTTS
jgi:hypothetical protein